jgi:hypothetical protein
VGVANLHRFVAEEAKRGWLQALLSLRSAGDFGDAPKDGDS